MSIRTWIAGARLTLAKSTIEREKRVGLRPSGKRKRWFRPVTVEVINVFKVFPDGTVYKEQPGRGNLVKVEDSQVIRAVHERLEMRRIDIAE